MMNAEKPVKKFEATFETQDGLFNKTIVWGVDENDVYRHINNEYDCPIVHYVRVVNEAGMPNPKPDMVNHPSHYCQGGIECIDAIKASMESAAFCGYLKGNCIKYLWRYDLKGDRVENLKKAKVYLEWLIDEEGK